MNEVISPELVLVSPELRERAIADLPVIELDAWIPRPRVSRSRSLGAPILDFLRIGAVAFATAVAVVTALTIVADALR